MRVLGKASAELDLKDRAGIQWLLFGVVVYLPEVCGAADS